MLNRQVTIAIVTAFIIGVGGVGYSWADWVTKTLIAVDKRTEVMAFKVEENHSMLKPLWEDFIKRSAHYGNNEESNTHANLKTTK